MSAKHFLLPLGPLFFSFYFIFNNFLILFGQVKFLLDFQYQLKRGAFYSISLHSQILTVRFQSFVRHIVIPVPKLGHRYASNFDSSIPQVWGSYIMMYSLFTFCVPSTSDSEESVKRFMRCSLIVGKMLQRSFTSFPTRSLYVLKSLKSELWNTWYCQGTFSKLCKTSTILFLDSISFQALPWDFLKFLLTGCCLIVFHSLQRWLEFLSSFSCSNFSALTVRYLNLIFYLFINHRRGSPTIYVERQSFFFLTWKEFFLLDR